MTVPQYHLQSLGISGEFVPCYHFAQIFCETEARTAEQP